MHRNYYIARLLLNSYMDIEKYKNSSREYVNKFGYYCICFVIPYKKLISTNDNFNGWDI